LTGRRKAPAAPEAKPIDVVVSVPLRRRHSKQLPEPYGPFMPHPLEGVTLLDALEDAETIEEWNEALGVLVCNLVYQSTPKGTDQGRIIMWAGDIRAFIARGFRPPENRPKKKLRAQSDAAYLRMLFGDASPNIRFQDAVDAIRARDKIPANKDIRARVKKAVDLLGWNLKPGKGKE
jgi:hypothetical protein